jgi:hypothetical protein
MDALFGDIPDGEALCAQLKDFRGRARLYYPATRTARYLRMEKSYAACVTVTDVSSVEASAISDEFDKGFAWNQTALDEVVGRVIGPFRSRRQ